MPSRVALSGRGSPRPDSKPPLSSEKNHRAILEAELESVGLRLNQQPPNIYFRKKKVGGRRLLLERGRAPEHYPPTPTPPSPPVQIGGIKFTSIVPLTKLGDDPGKAVYNILHEYKIHVRGERGVSRTCTCDARAASPQNAEILFREDASVDQLIDMLEGNRKYVRCLYVYNKADAVTIEDLGVMRKRGSGCWSLVL